LIESTSGNQMVISHLEAIYQAGDFYVARRPDGGYVAFPAESVCRFLDPP
jgi:hypothetical protein